MSGTPDAPPISKISLLNATPCSPGVEPERVYVDHGLTGTNRERPWLREALAACGAGDTLVVTNLDPLARPLNGRLICRVVSSSAIARASGKAGLAEATSRR